ncbi:MAG: hypothetical protein RLZZ557_1678 [Bacteroidota bacterium]|jgi:hypothetical protein
MQVRAKKILKLFFDKENLLGEASLMKRTTARLF